MSQVFEFLKSGDFICSQLTGLNFYTFFWSAVKIFFMFLFHVLYFKITTWFIFPSACLSTFKFLSLRGS